MLKVPKEKVKNNSPESIKTVAKIHWSVVKNIKHYKLVLLLLFLSSIAITVLLLMGLENFKLTVTNFIKVLLPYYSITIGFTITTTTFLVNSIKNENGLAKSKKYITNLIKLKNNYINSISLIIFYVFYSTFLLIVLFTYVLLSNVDVISGHLLVVFKIVVVPLITFLILYSFFLFTIITKVVYLYSISYIDNSIEPEINKLQDLKDEQ